MEKEISKASSIPIPWMETDISECIRDTVAPGNLLVNDCNCRRHSHLGRPKGVVRPATSSCKRPCPVNVLHTTRALEQRQSTTPSARLTRIA